MIAAGTHQKPYYRKQAEVPRNAGNRRKKAWTDMSSRAVAPQSELGKAITYVQGQIDRERLFLEHELLTAAYLFFG